MNKLLLHSITLFLLIIFVSLKVVNTHYLFHYFNGDEEIVNCDICSDFQNNVKNEFTSPGSEELEFNSILSQIPKDIKDFYVYLPKVVVTGRYFNKPPPAQA